MAVKRPGRRGKGRFSASLRRLGILAAVLFLATHASGAWAMAFIRSSEVDSVPEPVPGASHFADIVSYPHDTLRWPFNTVDYRLTKSFQSVFPSPVFARQVRVAFDTWDAAASTPNGVAQVYFSAPPAPAGVAFYDFRSLVLHEIGHALGLAHPNDAQPVGRDFSASPGGTLGPSPFSFLTQFWVMSTVDLSADQSAYNQILAWDDLAAFRYNYPGRHLSFARVLTPRFTQIRFDVADFTVGLDLDHDGSNDVLPTQLAVAHIRSSIPSDDWDDPTDPNDGPRLGRYIRVAEVWLNTHPPLPVGVRARLVNWEFRQLAAAAPSVRAVDVTTRAANNPIVMSHFDGAGYPTRSTPQPFTWFATVRDEPAVKDSLQHVWTDPAGGAIPGSATMSVGLMQDVHHWFATRLRLWHGTFSSASTDFTNVSVVDVQESANVVTSFPLRAAEVPAGRLTPHSSLSPNLQARPAGIVLRNPVTDTAAITLTALAIGDATRGGVNDVDAITLTHLTAAGVAQLFQMHVIPPAALGDHRVLRGGAEFHVFVTGDRSQLRPEMSNYLFVADVLGPEVAATLADRPLIVVATARSRDAEATTYTLVGAPPIAGLGSAGLRQTIYLPYQVTMAPSATP